MRTVLMVVAGLAVGLAPAAQAQGPNPGLAADAYATHAKQNAELMQKYTWKMRVQLTYKGEDKPAQLYQMNYVNGQLQKTLLSAPPAETGRKHGIKHRIKEKKIDEFKDWAAQLTDLVKRYMAPTPGTMMDFYSSATFSPVPSGNVRATDTGFIQPGDTATYWIDPATQAAGELCLRHLAPGRPGELHGPVRPGARRAAVRLDDQDLRAGEGSRGHDHEFQLSVEPVGNSRWPRRQFERARGMTATLGRAAAAVAILLAFGAPAARAQATELAWPRTLTSSDGMQVTFYQPQVDSWEYYAVLDYHMAIELQFPGASSTIPGTLRMTGQTSTDVGTQTVALYSQEIVSTTFPGVSAATAQQYRSIVQSVIPTTTMNLTLPQVQAYMTGASLGGRHCRHSARAPRARILKVGPGLPPTLPQPAPPIYYSESPAILVIFEGKPGFAPVTSGSTLLFSVNTNWAVFQDKNSGIVLPAGPGELAAGAERQRSVDRRREHFPPAFRTCRTTASGRTSRRTSRECPGGRERSRRSS